jgi:hypothetical protein
LGISILQTPKKGFWILDFGFWILDWGNLAVSGVVGVASPLENRSICQDRFLNWYYLLEVRWRLRGSRASRKPSPRRLNDNTVRMISNAGGQINQGWKIRMLVLVAIDNKLPHDGSGA